MSVTAIRLNRLFNEAAKVAERASGGVLWTVRPTLLDESTANPLEFYSAAMLCPDC